MRSSHPARQRPRLLSAHWPTRLWITSAINASWPNRILRRSRSYRPRRSHCVQISFIFGRVKSERVFGVSLMMVSCWRPTAFGLVVSMLRRRYNAIVRKQIRRQPPTLLACATPTKSNGWCQMKRISDVSIVGRAARRLRPHAPVITLASAAEPDSSGYHQLRKCFP